MKFEVSERIQTSATKDEVLLALEKQFKKVSARVTRMGSSISAETIEGTFGSINRKDTTTVEISDKDDGYLLVAKVEYRPSVAFWIILILCLFTYIFWLIPVIFYLVQKKSVRSGIEQVFSRIKNEFTDSIGVQSMKQEIKGHYDLKQLEKFELFRDKGVITEEEFQSKRKELLGL